MWPRTCTCHRRRGGLIVAAFVLLACGAAVSVHAQIETPTDPLETSTDPVETSSDLAVPRGHLSITDTRVTLPDREHLYRVLLLRDYNTRVVVIGTILLGIAAGVIGTFAYLRKRALMGDALSHATLPGVAAMFIFSHTKQLWLLTIGAAVTGILGVLTVIAIRSHSRLKEDAAIGIVLSVFFGCGIVLMSFVQQMGTGQEAGLQSFIYGKAAAMTAGDAWTIAFVAAVVIAGSIVFYKEFRIISFDQSYAATQGWPVVLIDVLMMSLVVLTTVIGLQAVGLILIVALLIIPAAAARFWTDRLVAMMILAGVFGALSGWSGATISALLPRMPTGALVVICAGVLFALSMLFAPPRGVIASVVRRWRLQRKVTDQHLLRAMAECEEASGSGTPMGRADLLRKRSWSERVLQRAINRGGRRGLVARRGSEGIVLTVDGRRAAHRVLRNHRLWELYLIKHADIAPSHVDRDADEIEHILSTRMIAELEVELPGQPEIPPSPHTESSSLRTGEIPA